MARPRGSRRVDVYGIKLNRRVQCFSDAAYHQWVCLEADPRVHAYCERPAFVEYGEDRLMVDYWVRKSDGDSLLILDEECRLSNAVISGTRYAVTTISHAELAAFDVWVENWERILPVITSCRTLVPDTLLKSVQRVVREPIQLSHIERELSPAEPTIVRAALFTLLHRGTLHAPQLLTEPLSFLTQFATTEDKS